MGVTHRAKAALCLYIFYFFIFTKFFTTRLTKTAALKRKEESHAAQKAHTATLRRRAQPQSSAVFAAGAPLAPFSKKKKKKERKSSTSHVQLSPSGHAYRLLKGASILTSTRGIAVLLFFFLHVCYVILPHCHIKETERKQTNKQTNKKKAAAFCKSANALMYIRISTKKEKNRKRQSTYASEVRSGESSVASTQMVSLESTFPQTYTCTTKKKKREIMTEQRDAPRAFGIDST